MRLVIEVDLAIQSQCDVRRVTGDVSVAGRIRVSFGLAARGAGLGDLHARTPAGPGAALLRQRRGAAPEPLNTEMPQWRAQVLLLAKRGESGCS